MSGHTWPHAWSLPFGHQVAGRELPICVALDPGGTTGWVRAIPGMDWVGGEIGPEPHHRGLFDLLRFSTPGLWVDHPLHVIYESFEFRQHYGSTDVHSKDRIELASVEYIGVVKLFAQQSSKLHGLSTATASSAKGFVSDEKLKRMGLYKPTAGKPHMRDALRHLIRYMVIDLRVHSPITDTWFGDE